MNTTLKLSAAAAALVVLSSGAAGASVCFLTGTSGDDTLTVPSLPPCDYVISGLAGDDTLTGGAGSDKLSPGSPSLVHSGHDTMTGGAGMDTFIIDGSAGSIGANAQEITDFTHAVDVIYVGSACASHGVTCTFIGCAPFSHTPGEVRYSIAGGAGYGLLQIDFDGDAVSDLDVRLDGGPAVNANDVRTAPPPLGRRLKKRSP